MSDIKLIQGDALQEMDKLIAQGVKVDAIITDIPYGAVNRESNGLRKLDKGIADVVNFNLKEVLEKTYKLTTGTVIIFCGQGQVSEIFNFFLEKQKNKEGTVRQLIWQKTNPSPMNGQHIYLSGIENAIWFKKRGGTFNAHCKNTVFKHPSGRSKLHPTEKNHKLLGELILDNTNVGDTILDPFMGSGSHGLVAKNLNRSFIGIELDEKYYQIAKERIENTPELLNNR